MKTLLKILKWTLLAAITLLIIGFLYLYFFFFAQPNTITSAKDITNYEWHKVLLQGETSCSDGSEYVIFLRKGSTDNLLIHFSGGGACWDDPTCGKPITILGELTAKKSKSLDMFYLPNITRFIPAILGGIFEADPNTNPFSDWNVVFIPYCTGDLHVGNSLKTYFSENGSFQIHHKGRNNSLAALNWIKNNYYATNKVVVSGESAGAYASAFWAPYVASLFPTSKIYQVSDASLLVSNRWSELMDSVWQADTEKYFHFTIERDVFEDALLKRFDSTDRQIKHLHSNTIYDEVLPKFSAALNHLPTSTNGFIDQWSKEMLSSMQRLSNSDLDYQYFISDCSYNAETHVTPHTRIGNKGYHSCVSDQMKYKEWLRINIIEDHPVSVGREFLQPK